MSLFNQDPCGDARFGAVIVTKAHGKMHSMLTLVQTGNYLGENGYAGT